MFIRYYYNLLKILLILYCDNTTSQYTKAIFTETFKFDTVTLTNLSPKSLRHDRTFLEQNRLSEFIYKKYTYNYTSVVKSFYDI